MVIVGGILPLYTTHVHDELQARCLALDNGDAKLLIVVCDSCMSPRAMFDEARRTVQAATGIPCENMLLSTTHTHSATAADWCHLTGIPDREYQRFVVSGMVDGMRRTEGWFHILILILTLSPLCSFLARFLIYSGHRSRAYVYWLRLLCSKPR